MTTQTATRPTKTLGQPETIDEARTPAQLMRFYGPDDQVDIRRCMHGYPGGHEKIPEADVALFAWRCKSTGLDPFQGHIVGIYREDRKAGEWKLSIQTEVAGLRVAAFRSGQLVEISEPVFDRARTGDDKGPPVSARVTVKRAGPTGNVMEFGYTAYLSEFKRSGPVWDSMPWHMLGLRAEGHALKRAFPDILAGLDLAGGDDDGDRPVQVMADTTPRQKVDPREEKPAAPPAPRSIPPAVKVGGA